MDVKTRIAVLLGALTLLAAPTAALAGGPTYAPEPEHPEHTHALPGPKASMPEKAKAYGVRCRGFSRKHVKGEKGTPFSRCVNAMAQAATSRTTTPRAACKGFSKAHVKGVEGTEFSRCVVAAAQVKKEAAAAG